MHHIRPSQLFQLVEPPSYAERTIRLVLPACRIPHADPILLETAVLVALTKIIDVEAIFEFGTFLGVQTLCLAMNLPESTDVFTLDLDRDLAHKTLLLEDPNDRKLADLQFAHESELAFVGTPYEPRIKRLYGDSNQFDFTDFRGRMNMVYVDGGHTLETRKRDSENAFQLLTADGAGCIAWHDYGNPNFSEITDYLDGLSNERQLYHVTDTMICFFWQNLPNIHLTHP